MTINRRLRHAFVALTTTLSIATAGRAQTPATWTLTETLRIGGGDTGPTSFNYIKSVAVDAKGRVFVYDRQAKEIRVFAPDGKFVKTIGRLGSGPGELRDAEGIAFAPDGMLWMRDAANARFTVFDAEGVYQHGWTMTFCSSQGPWNPQMDKRGRLLDVDCVVKGGRANGRAILGYHRDRSRIDTIAEMPACGTPALAEAGTFVTKRANGTSYRSIRFAPRYLTALGPSGEVWCVANSANYEITRIVPGARDTIRASRHLTPVSVTAAERDSIIKEFDAYAPGGLEASRIPKVKPLIDRIDADGEGRLWVMRSTANGGRELDVINASGRVIATMSLGKANASTYGPFSVRGDNIYLVLTDDNDVPFVGRFRITR